MEITRERLEREFDLDLISTSPNVVYRVVLEGKPGAEDSALIVTNPSDWPEGKIRAVYEPMVKCTIISPSEFIGTIMELCQSRRGELGGMDYLSPERVELRYMMPMGEIIFDFFDILKSRTRGYASLDYEESGEQEAALVKVDILLQGEAVDQAQGADSAPAVRGAHPGGDRRENHCPREHPCTPQGCALEVLWR
jgi:GTP-binding protein LepA